MAGGLREGLLAPTPVPKTLDGGNNPAKGMEALAGACSQLSGEHGGLSPAPTAGLEVPHDGSGPAKGQETSPGVREVGQAAPVEILALEGGNCPAEGAHDLVEDLEVVLSVSNAPTEVESGTVNGTETLRLVPVHILTEGGAVKAHFDWQSWNVALEVCLTAFWEHTVPSSSFF